MGEYHSFRPGMQVRYVASDVELFGRCCRVCAAQEPEIGSLGVVVDEGPLYPGVRWGRSRKVWHMQPECIEFTGQQEGAR